MTILHFLKYCIFTTVFLLFNAHANCAINSNDFAVEVSSRSIEESVLKSFDSIFLQQNVFETTIVKNAVQHSHYFNNRTIDFYLLVLLSVFLGIIRLSDPKYFFEIVQSFRNANLSNRQSKDKVLQKSFSNFLMNLFFVSSASTFCYYYIQLFTSNSYPQFSASLFVSAFLSIATLYLGKYLLIKFSGWAFDLDHITDQYLFNVFLLNKILGVLLLPILFCAVFSIPFISKVAFFLSICLIVSAFILRFFRSWKVFSVFFNYSKFHFFTYICASELMPIAVIVKFLALGIF